MTDEVSETTKRDLNNKRGQFSGKITRTAKKVVELSEMPLEGINPSTIEVHQNTLTQSMAAYLDIHSRIQATCEVDSQRDEDVRLEKVEDQVEELTSKLQLLRVRVQVHPELQDLQVALEVIQSSEVDQHHELQVKELKVKYEEVKKLGGIIVRQDPELNRMAVDIQKRLQTLSHEVMRAMPPVDRSTVRGTSEGAGPTSRPYGFDRKRELLKVELPTFRGDILQWPAFWKDFDKHIHSTALDEDDKLGYLKKYVQSPNDMIIIQNASTADGQYQEHVDLLLKKYNKPRTVHRLHTQELLSIVPMKNDTADELQRLQAKITSSILKFKSTRQYNIQSILTSYAETLLTRKAREEWKRESEDAKVVPDIDRLLDFLTRLAERQDEMPTERPPVKVKTEKTTNYPKKEKYESPYKKERGKGSYQQTTPQREVYAATSSWPICKLCKQDTHPLYTCSTFMGYNQKKRAEYVKKSKLCVNCLSSNHETTACRNSYRCRECGSKHHTALHKENEPTPEQAPAQGAYRAGTSNVQANSTISPTLEITVHSPTGKTANVTALFDTGASISLVTEDVASQLELIRSRSGIRIVGINGKTNDKPNSTVMLNMTSPHKEGPRLQTRAVVVKQIGSEQGGNSVEGEWPILKGLPLANPHFRQPQVLDVLLGNDVLADVEVEGTFKKDRSIKGGSFSVRNTIFGWVVNGRMPEAETRPPDNQYVCAVTKQDITPDLLKEQQRTTDCLHKFFESEALPEEKTQTAEDLEALEHYRTTHKVLTSGRFRVSLPKLQNHPTLGMSRSQAVKRYMSNERSLIRKKGLQPFQLVMAEYLDLQHAELVPTTDLNKPTAATYYLPMHAVYKDSTTSPLRVVFDASAETSTGVSLNDTLLTGPTVYPLLTDILIRFRLHNVALTSDISKMFRAIELTPEDRDMHRFVWRNDPQGRLQDYRMTRVTFGVSCSPFLATQTLQQIANIKADSYPEATQALRAAFYVDDCITGTATRQQAIQLQQQIQTVLGKYMLNIKKWRSNSELVLSRIPSELQERQPNTKPYGHTTHLKTLGVHWDASRDQFHVSTSRLTLPTTLTKRTLTSDVAQTFDVLGWFAPTTIVMKMIIQELWRAKCDWDDSVEDCIQQQWTIWKLELPALAEQPIPRHYFLREKPASNIQLHGFSDASLKGYAAAVYIRAVYPEDPPTVTLVTAKTKVAHLKGATVPRLELCGAQLLADLITHVRGALSMQPSQIQCWCDSQVVLYWLDGKRRQNRVYVANRVARVLEQVPSESWKHVPGIENPADCASRGISPQALLYHPLWWHGPPWLRKEPIQCPSQPADKDYSQEECVIRETVAVVIVKPALWLVDRYSDYNTIRRSLAWILRFTTNTRTKDVSQRTPSKFLTTEEIEKAEIKLYRQAQQRMVPANHPEKWSTDKTTKGLHPKVDEQGLYRVDGRLQNSQLAYSARHPIILRGTDPLTKKLIRHHHCLALHGGPSQVMTSLSLKFHVIHGMAVVKAACRKCVICIRFHAHKERQLMGQLPKYRVTPGHAFNVVGTDFAGPITITQGNPRRPQHVKAYICVFVCMCTKATHLEAVPGLTTADFMKCLKRFIGRRGKPAHIYSDNGTNFVGAARELEDIYTLLRSEETQTHITNYCTTDNIQWHFNPARAPHFGGIWEATVKSVKYHLRRLEYKRTFNYEEMSTILIQIESVLNSRPLMALHSHSAEGLEVLTAGHFLIGKPLTAAPERTHAEEENLRKRWESCQQVTQRFWRRWSSDYLQDFHKRSKWQKEAKNVEVGDIVLLREEQTFRTNEWPIARVVKVYPGRDGLVRAVDLQHNNKIWRRPIAKLTVLVPVKLHEKDGDGEGELQAVLFSRGRMSEFKD